MTAALSYHNGGRRPLSYKSPAHRIHTDVQPILSAIKHGKTRIATTRYHALCDKLNLVYWECLVLKDVIHAKCKELGIK